MPSDWRSLKNKNVAKLSQSWDRRIPPAGACDVDVEWECALQSAHCLQVAVDRGSSNKAMAVPADRNPAWSLFLKDIFAKNRTCLLFNQTAMC